MCGVIGFTGTIGDSEQLAVLKNVMVASRIRGMHASGIVWTDGTKMESTIKPIPIDQLVNKVNWQQVIGKKVGIIAHARYSTSDLKYNQPILGANTAIAHNGVITQSDPSTWEEKYGYHCNTKNDSELILRAIENGDDIWTTFPESSIAYVRLLSDGSLEYGRNGSRPLWVGEIPSSGIIVASTYHILSQSGVTNIREVESSCTTDLQRRCWKDVRTKP